MRWPSRGGTSPTTFSARTSFARAMTVARRRSGTSSTPRARERRRRGRGDESAEEPVAAGEVEADGVDSASRWTIVCRDCSPSAVGRCRGGPGGGGGGEAGDGGDGTGRRRGGTTALGITLDVRHVQLEKYKRPKTWRDILSATRERVKKGRAAMSTPMAEDGTTNEAWSRERATDARIRGQI